MPLTRHLFRGYNQAEEIARALATRLQRPILQNGILLRHATGAPQARHRSRQERHENLAGAYTLKQPDKIRGLRILLVDDVMTTGATVSHAATALLTAGAREINVFTPVRARLGEDRDNI